MPIQRLQAHDPSSDSLIEFLILALQATSLDVIYHLL